MKQNSEHKSHVRTTRPKSRAFAAALLGTLLVSGIASHAITIDEHFNDSPFTRGWKTAGDNTLFDWNSTSNHLEVTWDSARPNSYFYRPLGATLTKTQDFTLTFSFELHETGYYPEKPNGFQIAIGFINLAQATNSSFLRGTGFNSPNVVEFDYFPPSNFDATVAPTFISQNNEFASSFNFPVEILTNVLTHVTMTYTASNQTLVTVITQGVESVGPIQNVVLGPGFSDFEVDTLAISSYDESGQFPGWEGSILARGTIYHLAASVPGIPIVDAVSTLSNGTWQVTFNADAQWKYTLKRTTDFSSWNDVTFVTPTAAGAVTLADPAAPPSHSFYRVVAEKTTIVDP